MRPGFCYLCTGCT